VGHKKKKEKNEWGGGGAGLREEKRGGVGVKPQIEHTLFSGGKKKTGATVLVFHKKSTGQKKAGGVAVMRQGRVFLLGREVKSRVFL